MGLAVQLAGAHLSVAMLVDLRVLYSPQFQCRFRRSVEANPKLEKLEAVIQKGQKQMARFAGAQEEFDATQSIDAALGNLVARP